MRSAREIQDSINLLRDELDAIIAVSEREERDLNEDESTRVTEITDGLIPTLSKQLKTTSKVEQERNARTYKRMEDEISAQQVAAGLTDTAMGVAMTRFGGIKIPAKAKVHSPLKAFIGENAEQEAYIAGSVILAGIFGNESASQFCRNHGIQVNNTMTTGTNTAGGFLVPDEMSRSLIRLREERGIFPKFANKVPMGSDIITVPRILSDVTVYWVAEAAEITPSDVTLGMAELMARKLAALTKVSSELDEDAVIDIGDMITQSMAYQMADKIDEAGFNGDGTSTYGGILGLKNALDANAISTAITGNVGASSLDLADFEAVIGMYPHYQGANPRWFMHPAVYWAAAGRLADAAGGNSSQNFADGPNTQMFLGYPVTMVPVMASATGSAVSTIVAYFGDLRLGASYGTRRSFRTEVSTERYFEFDVIGIKATERIAILIHERGDTIRTRPIIALKTAAS